MQRLFLDNREVELLPKKIAQTYQINDLAEVKDRNLHHTQRFFLPPTPQNVDVMQYLGVSGSKSRKPYIKIPAKYVYNGVELMATGYAKVNEASAGGYNVTVYDGNASLYEVLTGRRLNDLDYSDINHTLNGSTHLASLDNTSGYIYALVDSGYVNTSGVVNSERQVASLYKHTLFDKIMTQAGFTYSGDIFTDAEFLKEVVGITKGYDVVGENPVETAKGTTASNTISKIDSTLTDPQREIETFTHTGTGLTGISIQESSKIQFDVAGLYKIEAIFDYTVITGFGSLYAKYNGSYAGGLSMFQGTNQTGNLTFNIQAEAGDVLEFIVDHTAEPGNEGFFEISFNASVDVSYKLSTGGLFIDFSQIMPEVSQTAFIKSIMQDYGLIFQARKNSMHYHFTTMEALVNDRDNAQDWSDKLLNTGAETYQVGKYAKNNYMLYKYESDDVQDTSYDGNLTADHENISDETTLFTSLYTIANRTQYRNTHPIYSIPVWKEKDEQEGTVIQNQETQLRSFKIKYISEAVTFQFGSVVGNYTRADNMPFLSLENMEYDYYIANYWSGFKRILDAQKKRTVTMLLKPADIYALDFLKLKYLKQLGQYFYLNKVANFIDDTETSVVLIQVNDLTVNQPPNQLGQKTFTINANGNKVISLMDFLDTTPVYSDPEYDEPETIKITSGFNSEIAFNINGLPIASETEFDANNFTAAFVDLGTNQEAHTAIFNWTIQSFNNGNFSAQTGTFVVNVREEVNLAPIADAGGNQSVAYDSDTNPDFIVSPYGTGSSDPNGDVLTYLWEADALPIGVTLTNATGVTCTLTGTNLTPAASGQVITMTLTVTDPAGLSDTDTMTVTLFDLNTIQ